MLVIPQAAAAMAKTPVPAVGRRSSKISMVAPWNYKWYEDPYYDVNFD